VDASRRFASELSNLLDKKIRVLLVDGKVYEGVLNGFDHQTLSLLLNDAVDDKGRRYPKVIIRGDRVSEILILEIPLFDPEDFKNYIIREMKLPEHLIQVVPEAKAVIVQGRYKVSESGVEGSGPTAEKLYQYYTKYIEERRKKIQGT